MDRRLRPPAARITLISASSSVPERITRKFSRIKAVRITSIEKRFGRVDQGYRFRQLQPSGEHRHVPLLKQLPTRKTGIEQSDSVHEPATSDSAGANEWREQCARGRWQIMSVVPSGQRPPSY